jgi:hypothetical protein
MTGPEGTERLGFTTHLGSHWEMWQVFRELYSNCLDEGGELTFAAVEPREGHTTVHVSGYAVCRGCPQQGSRFFLTPQAALDSGALVDVHPGASDGVYYRSVLVSQPAKGTPPSPTTSTAEMTLTEDRTLKRHLGHRQLHRLRLSALHQPGRPGQGADREGVLRSGSVFRRAVFSLRRGGPGACREARRYSHRPGPPSRPRSTWAQREARVKPAPLTNIESAKSKKRRSFCRGHRLPDHGSDHRRRDAWPRRVRHGEERDDLPRPRHPQPGRQLPDRDDPRRTPAHHAGLPRTRAAGSRTS